MTIVCWPSAIGAKKLEWMQFYCKIDFYYSYLATSPNMVYFAESVEQKHMPFEKKPFENIFGKVENAGNNVFYPMKDEFYVLSNI